MDRLKFLPLALLLFSFAFERTIYAKELGAESPCNVVLIFCDDLGYGDLGCYGSTVNRTPNIDRLAAEGRRFTDFYSSSPVCTPSRASLMTGCYPRRVGLHEDATGHWVLIPRSRRGLNPEETTLPEILKTAGYATACIGKWHLGDQVQHLPIAHGFDKYFGIPYSNDMQQAGRGDPPLPLVEQVTVIEAPADQTQLTQQYTREAVEFIESHQREPFFLYLPHTFPHLPLHASERFLGKSRNGRYGDSVEEIDWSTGEILECLKRLGLKDNTMVIFTSDNGSNGRNGGSNAPLAGRKGSTMEGGMRVPMVVRLPGIIPAGTVCSELATTMDLLPTLASFAKGKMPTHEHLPLANTFPRWNDAKFKSKGRPGKLIDLETDLKEQVDVSSSHPQVMAKMRAFAKDAMQNLGNEAEVGSGQRKSLTLDQSVPMILP